MAAPRFFSQLISEETRASYGYLLRWVAVSLWAGALAALVVAGVRWVLDHSAEFLLVTAVPPPIFAAAGALIAGFVIYKLSPDAAGEGIPAYLFGLNHQNAHFPWRPTVAKLPATLLTLGAFGTGGLVGPVGRAVAGLVALPRMHRSERAGRDERARTAAICGMAGVVSSLFFSPIGGGIFAVEIIQRANMRYRDLFPAVLTGAVAVAVSRGLGLQPMLSPPLSPQLVHLRLVPAVLLFCVFVAVLAAGFVRGYALTVRLFRRDQGFLPAKLVVGATAAVALVWLVNPLLLGDAGPLMEALPGGDTEPIFGILSRSVPLVVAALIMALVRTAAAYLTTGSGMSAGLTGPAIQVGLLCGLAAARLVVPEASFPVALPFLVVGFSGMLAGSMNVPIAAAVMSVEIFGIEAAIPAAAASIIAFQVNRHQTIYDYAIAGSGHLEAEK